MDIVSILSSLNIIGLIAFLITLGFLLFEIFMLSGHKKDTDKPHVPKFEEGAQPLPPTLQIKENRWQNLSSNLTKNNKLVLISLIILLVFFGGLTLMGSLSRDSSPQQHTTAISPTRTLVQNTTPRPTQIDETVEIPTPAEANIFPTEVSELEPTEVLVLESETQAPTAIMEGPTSLPTEGEEPTALPTVIEELPVTSNTNNTLILFGAAVTFFFFAFLF